MTTFRRKPHRLPLTAYSLGYAVAITAATQGRHPAFSNSSWARRFVVVLEEEAQRLDASVYAYCFMPDHLHLIVACPPGTSVVDFVGSFKQKTAYAYVRATGRRLWQKSFYDRVQRCEDDLLAVARYVFQNPVRAGMVARADEYVDSGSFVWGRSVLVEA